ncbi:hypothetical protein [Aestuariivirga litoralis]|uniref:hypothetical protein n=1 Tax=Aestuariivirga litoralis TaxID=2650924 RepID=UPI0018C5928D|nr:hypothetical protein [Aestuariivirga litoralis]MBG1231350.1 hypothetical protein [Aestuariivirga litoralis]
MKQVFAFAFVAMIAATPALAEGISYANARFAYEVSIPLEVSTGKHVAETGEAVTSMSKDGKALLAVWGGKLIQPSFVEEVKAAQDGEHVDGWDVKIIDNQDTYSAFYGTMAEQIYYERMIPSCDGAAAVHYRLEFPVARKAEFEGAVKELDASLKSVPGSCKLD